LKQIAVTCNQEQEQVWQTDHRVFEVPDILAFWVEISGFQPGKESRSI
jgi:hypothetical protein